MNTFIKRFGLLLCLWMLAALTVQAQTPAVIVGGNDTIASFLIAGSNNMTLYTFANDPAGASSCEGGCLENWPAYTVASPADATLAPGIPGFVSVITRSDGALQIAYNDRPLYFFIGDQAPGDATGEGAGGVWYVVRVEATAAAVEVVEPVVTEEPATTTDTAAPVTTTSTVTSSLPDNGLIATNDTKIGLVLADINLMTLYTFANDVPGTSNCVDRCLELWPPLLVASADALPAADSGLLASLNVITRPEGTFQVALNDRPLYFYSEDLSAGDVNGQGVGSVWFAVTLDVVRAGGNADLGSFLVAGSNNMTLYTFANDVPGTSNCVDRCVEIWPPLLFDGSVPLFDLPAGTLSVIDRPEGTQQLAINDRPLYFYSEDVQPGDAVGQGVGSVWFVVTLDTVRVAIHPQFGSILTDTNGMSLYTFGNDEPGWSNCVGECSGTWPPFLAGSEDAVFGPASIDPLFTTTSRAEGTEQVNFDDRPLYLFVGDQQPGDTSGDGVGGVWSVARVNGAALPAGACMVTVNVGEVNLRAAPSTDAELAGNALNGAALLADGQQAGSDGFVWFRLVGNAWVRSDVVSAASECSSLPQITG